MWDTSILAQHYHARATQYPRNKQVYSSFGFIVIRRTEYYWFVSFTKCNGNSTISGNNGDPCQISSRIRKFDKVGESLIVSFNSVLTNLFGLTGLVEITGGLVIHDNRALVSIAGLRNLKVRFYSCFRRKKKMYSF